MMETIDLAIFLVFMGGVGTTLGLCFIVIRLGAKDTAALRSRQRAEQVRSEERALELGKLPDWWKWAPADAWAHPIHAFVERDGEWVAWVYSDNTFQIRLESAGTYVEGCASIDEAKAACERAYLALVGVVGKGGG